MSGPNQICEDYQNSEIMIIIIIIHTFLSRHKVVTSEAVKKPIYRLAGLLIYSCKDEISAWKFREKKLLQIMLCLGAPGLGTPCCGSSGVRGLSGLFSSIYVFIIYDNDDYLNCFCIAEKQLIYGNQF